MKDIDLRPWQNDYRVPTSKDGYMGPDVIVTARDAEHAKEIVQKNGLTPNRHFPPTKVNR